MKALRKSIDDYTKNLDGITLNEDEQKKNKKILDILEKYYDINNRIINHFNIKFKNYQILSSVKNLIESNQIIIKDLEGIINENDRENKIKKLDEIYEKMTKK